MGCSARKCLPRVGTISGKGKHKERLELTSENKEGKEVVVDFGTTVLGGKISRFVELVNDGSLPSNFEVLEISENTLDVNSKSVEGKEFSLSHP